MQAVYLHPLTDFGFRYLFGHSNSHQVITHFLNTFLPDNYQIDQILKIQVGFQGYSVFDSSSIIDVQCISQRGEIFVVELVKALGNYGTHTSAAQFELPIYQSTLIPSEQTRLFVIAVLGFSLKADEIKAENIFCYSAQLNSRTNFIALNPHRFDKSISDLKNDSERWLYLLTHLPELDSIPSTFGDEFSQMFKLAKLSHLSAEERGCYEQSLKYYRDLKNVLITARS